MDEQIVSGIDVLKYGVKCDGVTDDGPAIQALLNKLSGGHMDFPAGRFSRVNQALVAKASVGMVDANLDFSQAPAGIVALSIIGGPNDYANGTVAWQRVALAGNKAGIGLMLAANHLTLNQFTIHDFVTDVQLGPNGYSVTFNQPFLYNAIIAFYCAQEPNAGEQIVVNGGSLFNSGSGIQGGGAGMTMVGSSIDGMSNQSIVWWGGGFRAYGIHIENFVSPAGPIIENAGGNDYCFMEFEGLEVYQTSGNAILQSIKNPTSGATIHYVGYRKLSGNVQ